MTPKHTELLATINSHDMIVADKSDKFYFHNYSKFDRPMVITYNNNLLLQDLIADKLVVFNTEHKLCVVRKV